jgi:predicted MFS family arabinose efflux permease
MSVFRNVGGVLGAAGGGVVLEQWGSRVMYLGMAGIVVAAMGLLYCANFQADLEETQPEETEVVFDERNEPLL